jgi:hypothetical protein
VDAAPIPEVDDPPVLEFPLEPPPDPLLPPFGVVGIFDPASAVSTSELLSPPLQPAKAKSTTAVAPILADLRSLCGGRLIMMM